MMLNEFEVAEATIIIKASPQYSQKHGETVCCAGVTNAGEWVRLYPVTFRTLDEGRQFGRWDRLRFRWKKPSTDTRPESRRVDHQSLEIIGMLKAKERHDFLSRLEVTSLDAVASEGKSLALLRPKNPKFIIEKKTAEAFEEEQRKIATFSTQPDLFNTKPLIPLVPCPYKFKYQYTTDDGTREGTCQDWETDATFYNQSRTYGEKAALEFMQRMFGEEYPRKGMTFAMGTHSVYPDTWLINGIIRQDEISQLSLDF